MRWPLKASWYMSFDSFGPWRKVKFGGGTLFGLKYWWGRGQGVVKFKDWLVEV